MRPPSVDRLARDLAESGFLDLPAPLLVAVAREAVARSRDDPASAWERAKLGARQARQRLLQHTINATGVIIHTNLGRAPLPIEQEAAYSNLELDLSTGRRGDRSTHAAALLGPLCGAEAATIVNNGAAALLLVLAALAPGREVVLSRGEEIEIGGGFRVPEVLASSGAHLREVGTTNRTRLSDYRNAIGPETGAILKVHQSNYRILGFTEAVSVRELAGLSPEVPVVFDVGSGLVDERCQWLTAGPPSWLRGEPAVRQAIDSGADIVVISGDKLFGGPQAGIIAGRADLVDACKRHPLARALRPGHLVLHALQKVTLSYLRRDAGTTLPVWKMATASEAELRQRAAAIVEGGVGELIECQSVMGGGTLPGTTIPSVGVAVSGDISAQLRAFTPPVVARVENDVTVCDLRTVLPAEDEMLGKALAR